jgi:hypothetical protein
VGGESPDEAKGVGIDSLGGGDEACDFHSLWLDLSLNSEFEVDALA